MKMAMSDDGSLQIANGQIVDGDVFCPSCGHQLKARGGMVRARHFYHKPGEGNCRAEYNPTHKRSVKDDAIPAGQLELFDDFGMMNVGPKIEIPGEQVVSETRLQSIYKQLKKATARKTWFNMVTWSRR